LRIALGLMQSTVGIGKGGKYAAHSSKNVVSLLSETGGGLVVMVLYTEILEVYSCRSILVRIVHNYLNAVWAQVQELNLILDNFPKILQKVSARLDLSSFRDLI
jgi:hypothetical protein